MKPISKIILTIALPVLMLGTTSCLDDEPLIDWSVIEPVIELADSDHAQYANNMERGDVAEFMIIVNYTASYEWRFTLNTETEPYLIRYEQDTEFTFTDAGTHSIVLYATFVNGNDTIAYTQDYWADRGPLTVNISESRLEMPNAFSPNGDGINDIYQAKTNYQSIVEFHAYIFNRWGKKLYEWDDPAGGWDGTYKGKDVAQGVYFVLVKARGADGREYNIRRDVNLLKGYTESTGTEIP